MAYNIGWGTKHPGYLVWLVDLSESMNQKIDYVLDSITESCDELTKVCSPYGKILNRMSIHIIGYNSEVFTLFKGSVIDLDARLEETHPSAIFDKTKEAKPQWQTYTTKAVQEATKSVKEWIGQQSAKGIPMPVPIVIHITDGYPFEEENRPDQSVSRNKALAAIKELKEISVPDGSLLFFNIHIGAGKDPIRLPTQRPTDTERAYLFDASSVMPDIFIKKAQLLGFSDAKENSRFMVSNETDKRLLTRLIIFGSTLVSDVTPYDEQAKPS